MDFSHSGFGSIVSCCYKALSTLSPKTATVAENGDCRRIRRLLAFSATFAVFGDKLSPKSAIIVASVVGFKITDKLRAGPGVRPIFSRVAEPSLPENNFDSPRNNCYTTCKICLPDSPHQIFIGKNPGFRALHIAGWNEFRDFFCLINAEGTFFSLFWQLASAQKIAFTWKIMAFPDSEGCSRPAIWLVRHSNCCAAADNNYGRS